MKLEVPVCRNWLPAKLTAIFPPLLPAGDKNFFLAYYPADKTQIQTNLHIQQNPAESRPPDNKGSYHTGGLSIYFTYLRRSLHHEAHVSRENIKK